MVDTRPDLPFEEIVAPSGNPIEDMVYLALPPLDDKAALLTWRRDYAALLAAAVLTDNLPRTDVGIDYDLFVAAVRRHHVAVDEDLDYRITKGERQLGITAAPSDTLESRSERIAQALGID